MTETQFVRDLFGTRMWGNGDEAVVGGPPSTVSIKYDDSEPRDEQGRWTGDGGGSSGGGHTGLLGAYARGWGSYAAAMRSVLTGAPMPVPATGEPMNEAAQAFFRQGGQLLLTAANESKPTTYSLYRGIAVSPSDYAKLSTTFGTGKSVDLNLSSWTKGEDIATQFASNSFNTVAKDPSDPRLNDLGLAIHQVIFACDPGAHALNITNDIPQGPEYTEHLMAGRFEVTGIDHESLGAAVEGMTRDTIHLTQTATLDPSGVVGAKVLKYSNDEPRDDHGRWTSDGGSAQPITTPTSWWGEQHYGAYRDSLSHSEKVALLDYQEEAYERVNAAARAGRPGMDSQVKVLDRVIAGAPKTPEPIVVWRGVGSSGAAAFSGLGKGDSFTDHGFVSTSISHEVAEYQATDTLMRITLPAGSSAMYLSGIMGEQEMLLPRDTSFTYDGRDKEGVISVTARTP